MAEKDLDVHYREDHFNPIIGEKITYYFEVRPGPFRGLRYGVYHNGIKLEVWLLTYVTMLIVPMIALPVIFPLILGLDIFEMWIGVEISLLAIMVISIPSVILFRFILMPVMIHMVWFRKLIDLFVIDDLKWELEEQNRRNERRRRSFYHTNRGRA